MEDTPILWHSNAPWAGTGYGTQTALFAPRVADLGYDLAFSAFFGLQGRRLNWVAGNGKPYMVYPRGRDAYGNDVLVAHAAHWFGRRSGLVVLLTDPWVIDARIAKETDMLAWIPVDHQPLMGRTHRWIVESRAIPLAMSRFGEKQMRDMGHDPLYVPHGFDPKVFHRRDKAELRKKHRIPQDAFVVGMVAANKGVPSRKCFAEAITAFQQFRNEGHDQAVLYLHTKLQDPEGEKLPVLCETLGVTPYTSHPYEMELGMEDEEVAEIMGCFDVLLNPSQGEGFGVPMIEAQACGVPVITTNFSASPEIAPPEHGNWAVEGQPTWTNFQSWQMRPSIPELIDALVEAYTEPTDDRHARSVGVETWANENYQADYITETFWGPALEEAMARVRFQNRLMARA